MQPQKNVSHRDSERTAKQPRQHSLCTIIPSKDILIQYTTDPLGVNFPLEERQIIGVILLLVKTFLELGFVTHCLHNIPVNRKSRSLIALTPFVGNPDILWRSAECIHAEHHVHDVIYLTMSDTAKNKISGAWQRNKQAIFQRGMKESHTVKPLLIEKDMMNLHVLLQNFARDPCRLLRDIQTIDTCVCRGRQVDLRCGSHGETQSLETRRVICAV